MQTADTVVVRTVGRGRVRNTLATLLVKERANLVAAEVGARTHRLRLPGGVHTVLEERPWPNGYEGWRPPPEWRAPTPPEGWDVA